MNKELADFGNAPSGPMMHFQQAQFTMAKPRAVNQPAPAEMAAEGINCAKSMNSDAFSHFSLPSNNLLVNAALNQPGGLNVPSTQKRSYANQSGPTGLLDMNLQ